MAPISTAAQLITICVSRIGRYAGLVRRPRVGAAAAPAGTLQCWSKDRPALPPPPPASGMAAHGSPRHAEAEAQPARGSGVTAGDCVRRRNILRYPACDHLRCSWSRARPPKTRIWPRPWPACGAISSARRVSAACAATSWTGRNGVPPAARSVVRGGRSGRGTSVAIGTPQAAP